MTAAKPPYRKAPEAALRARPDASTCICGAVHYGGRDGWLKNWCGTECCWNEETCRSCGATYQAVTGVLLHGRPKPPKSLPQGATHA